MTSRRSASAHMPAGSVSAAMVLMGLPPPPPMPAVAWSARAAGAAIVTRATTRAGTRTEAETETGRGMETDWNLRNCMDGTPGAASRQRQVMRCVRGTERNSAMRCDAARRGATQRVGRGPRVTPWRQRVAARRAVTALPEREAPCARPSAQGTRRRRFRCHAVCESERALGRVGGACVARFGQLRGGGLAEARLRCLALARFGRMVSAAAARDERIPARRGRSPRASGRRPCAWPRSSSSPRPSNHLPRRRRPRHHPCPAAARTARRW